MNLYHILLDNGESYEEYSEISIVVLANNKEEAIRISKLPNHTDYFLSYFSLIAEDVFWPDMPVEACHVGD